jgi:glutamate racemase
LHAVLEDLNIEKQVDVLILGCTHFPILAKQISEYFENSIQLVDSGVAIASRVSYLLDELGLLAQSISDIKKPLQYYATANVFSDKLAVKLVTLIDPPEFEGR